MSYVDGFVLPIPKSKAAAYKQVAKQAAKLWLEHGARSYFECIGDDVKPGKLTSFPQAVQLKEDEVAWFSWIVFASKNDRNRINKLVMSDPRGLAMMEPMKEIFDVRRMIVGGFKVVVEASAG